MKEKVKAFTLLYIWPLRLSVQYFALYPDAKRSLTIDKKSKIPELYITFVNLFSGKLL